MDTDLVRALKKAKKRFGYKWGLPNATIIHIMLDKIEDFTTQTLNQGLKIAELEQKLRTATKPDAIYVKAEICPECKGKGSYYTTDNFICQRCPKEGCCGPHDRPTCGCLWYKCSNCEGKGITNSPESPVIAKDPLAPYRH